MMIMESLFPVVFMLALGKIAALRGLLNETFMRTADRLVYFIFFPSMLFWKIGGASTRGVDWSFVGVVLVTLMGAFLLSIIVIGVLRVPRFTAGAFSQSTYRFNTYIGMAVVMHALGEKGIREFGLLIGFVIPVLNLLAVSTLIWFTDRPFDFFERIRYTLKAIIINPLILACSAGLLWSKLGIPIPRVLDNTLSLMSMVTLPLALLSIGGNLSTRGIRGHFKLTLAGSVIKLALLPLAGYWLMSAIGVTSLQFKVGLIFFALPTATSIYILSSQLASDIEHASAAITVSTLLSFCSLSLVLML